MRTSLYYILVFGFSILLFTGCSDEKEGKDGKKESKEEDKEAALENEVKEVVMSFFVALDNYNFNTAKNLSTKASYSSVKFLDKISGDYNSAYIIEVKSCDVKENKAVCLCEFGYYDEESIERSVEVEKYDDEWLVNFQLGKNFDNIFVYDYGYELNGNIGLMEPMPIDTLLGQAITELIQRLNSSYMKLGFSSESNILSVDPLYEGGTTYGYSDLKVGDCMIHTSYDYRDDKLSSCTVTIDGRDYGVDVNQYLTDIYYLIVDELGEPFNLPEKLKDDPKQLWEMRWFIKSYNEMLVLTSLNGRIQLSLEEIR